MAELAASIIGIVSAGTKVTLVLSQLAAEVGSAGKEARMIGSEIRAFCSVVKTLGETLEKVQESPYYAHCAEMIKDMTDASLEMFTEILNAADAMKGMVKGKDGKDGKFGFVGRVQWAVFQKPKILVLRAAIEAYKSNLALMLGTLNTAERVGRRMSMINTQEVIAEDKQDRSVLESLQLEHQASLIELEEAEREFNENPIETANETDPLELSHSNNDLHGKSEEERLGLVRTPADAISWTEGLVDSAREEIQSIRSSLSRTSTFDTGVVQEQVARYSQRLSFLMSEDQHSISQRWSIVLSPSYEDNTYSPTTLTSGTSKTPNLALPKIQVPPVPLVPNSPETPMSSQKVWPPVNIARPETASKKIYPPVDIKPRRRPRKKNPPSTDIELPTFPINYKNRDPPIRNNKETSALSDPFYLDAFNLLMMRSLEDRKIILDALMKGVYGTKESNPNFLHEGTYGTTTSRPSPGGSVDSTNQATERTNKPPTEYESRIEEYKKKLEEIRGTPQWHQALEIYTSVKRQMQAKMKEAENAGETAPLIAIDLNNLAIEYLPDLLVEILRSNLETLSISRNLLTELPENIAACYQLRSLDLRSNKFTTIPHAVLQLPSLVSLDMSSNLLQAIPGTICKLESLTTFSVEGNQIQGLPFALGMMPNLQKFNWKDNPVIFPPKKDLDELWVSSKFRTPYSTIRDLRTYNLKTYLRAYPAKISENDARAILGLLPPSLETISAELPVFSPDATPAPPALTLDTDFSSPEEIQKFKREFPSSVSSRTSPLATRSVKTSSPSRRPALSTPPSQNASPARPAVTVETFFSTKELQSLRDGFSPESPYAKALRYSPPASRSTKTPRSGSRSPSHRPSKSTSSSQDAVPAQPALTIDKFFSTPELQALSDLVSPASPTSKSTPPRLQTSDFLEPPNSSSTYSSHRRSQSHNMPSTKPMDPTLLSAFARASRRHSNVDGAAFQGVPSVEPRTGDVLDDWKRYWS
ncbi:hypothetical protein K505DRAFT_331692 [Melanomma pulvis-pyrius CBS 109.77]|uniref:L domain-like protein n=1 Tax=Melanomma pulvis-pyrius CBS 109.77 TaxID=1314802 RepID=A0A6A6XVK6_9PLEO|nr:hypothetical protein K505DRAFT_331692 [Melanomma pulvis-pyrius CBS 109.77]